QAHRGGDVLVVPLALEVRLVRAEAVAARILRRPLVPVDAEPVKPVEYRLDRLGPIPHLVGVVDAEDELAAVPPGVEPVETRRADAADVQVAGRARGEAGAGHCGVRSAECGVRN